MMAGLTELDLDLLHGPNYAQLVTLDEGGSPQVTVTWADASDGYVLVNTAEGRKKDRNMRRDPRVAVSVMRSGDPYRWISVRGTVVERITGPQAEAHIDFLNCKYHDGERWTYLPGQVRVLYRIRPDRIVRYGE
jgi:PPOX class probable F420-dependent enzyme